MKLRENTRNQKSFPTTTIKVPLSEVKVNDYYESIGINLFISRIENKIIH